MQITDKGWKEYIADLRKLNQTAADRMRKKIVDMGLESFDMITPEQRKELIEYAYALVTKYGEGSAELACEFYDLIADLSGVGVPVAEPAATATYGEVAKAVNGTMKTGNPEIVVGAIERLVKLAGADTTLKNAERDRAQWAWIPSGDTCAFCITLASRGWQTATIHVKKGDHAEHIHSHCDCMFAVRFSDDFKYESYDPDKYLDEYNHTIDDGIGEQRGRQSPADAKVNAMRRKQYEQNKEEINARARENYRRRQELKND